VADPTDLADPADPADRPLRRVVGAACTGFSPWALGKPPQGAVLPAGATPWRKMPQPRNPHRFFS